MGVYIFSWDILKKKLEEDEQDPDSAHDFGKNIIPNLLNENKKLIAYRFQGYWKDVGTIESLWEANMDLLDRPEEINLMDPVWRIYSRNPVKPAHFIAKGAVVHNSCLTDGCVIEGKVTHSVIFNSVVVEKGAIVKDSVLMPGVVVKAGAYVNKAIVGSETTISKKVKIGYSAMGESPYINTKICTNHISVIERGLVLKEGANIPCNSMVEYREDIPDEQSVVKSYEKIL